MFHAPLSGRITDHPQYGSTDADGNNGAFQLTSPEPGWSLLLLISDEPLPGETMAWEHVSVHAVNAKGKLRTPSWKEMCFVKALCWDAEDLVIQYHPRASYYVNLHPHTLHLWRPVGCDVPTPPLEMI